MNAQKGKYTWKPQGGDQGHFNLVAGNGEIIAAGKSKQSLDEAKGDMMIIQRFGRDLSNYEVLPSRDNKSYWVFRSPIDGDIKLTSETFEKKSGAKTGIESAVRVSATTRLEGFPEDTPADSKKSESGCDTI